MKSRRAYLATVMMFLTIWSGGPLAQSEVQSPRDRGFPDPESGSVAGGTYTNPYFGLSYRLPVGWTEGLKGPPPSNSGYYVLASFDGEGE